MSQHFTMTTSLLREITPHFAGTEDAAFIGLIGQVRQQAEAALQERNKKTKQLIKDMSEGVHAMEEDIARAERGEDEARQLRAAREEKENAKLQLEALEGQNRLLDNKLAEIESQKRDLNEALLELKQSKLVEIPLIKHALGLYANITSLRWDYGADSVKGQITCHDDVKQFDFSAGAPTFDVANKLWDMMAM